MSPLVPTVDLTAPSAAVAAAVAEAGRTVGFFHVVGHGVDPARAAGVLAAMDAFFTGPVAGRRSCAPASPDVNRGWTPPGVEGLGYSLGVATPPDLVEAFVVGPEHPDLSDPAVLAERHGIFHPNLWPADRPAFAAAVTAWFDAAAGVARRLLGLFAPALGLPGGWFDGHVRHPTETMRLNHYGGGAEPAPGQQRLGAHTDYGMVTVLLADPVPGLEVLGPDGAWHGVVPAPGALVVNLGDLTARWTNDRWRSTLHRVVPGPHRRRSVAFFLDGDHDAVVSCLPTCTSADDPPRYGPVVVGDHLRAKIVSGRVRDLALGVTTGDTLGTRRAALADG